MLYFIGPVSAAGFNPGQNGAPTGGTPTSDLLGGTATFTFEQNAILFCNGDSATSFDFVIDYSVDGAALPDGATLVVYLSPNQGAINNNGGSDPAGYISAVESNYFVANVGGLIGTGSFTVTVTVTSSFDLSGGGVLGVFADEASYAGTPGSEWTSKSNSVQCSEAQSVAESASVAESVPPSVAESVPASAESVAASASGEQSVEAGTGTPAGSISNGAFFGSNSSPLPTIAFSLILLASLGTLAYANVKTVRNRS
ncbi:MAG TPA: hypothetical protein VIM66_06705 [Candidatus Limnocylindria bacterium]